MQIGKLNENIFGRVDVPLYSQVQTEHTNETKVKEKDKARFNEAKVATKEIKNEVLNKEPQIRLNDKNLDEVIEELNKNFEMFNTRMSFSYDEESKITVIKILNQHTGEVIKQIPPEDMLNSLEKISALVGLVIDKSA